MAFSWNFWLHLRKPAMVALLLEGLEMFEVRRWERGDVLTGPGMGCVEIGFGA
ncbi:hypothetical protein BKA81DRAFT_371671 [Phyllosticta paracitricarpa]